ncbi:hypothetical protein EDB84DRAFT_1659369 [Lactarius hengduanensis]|nr:hypothetical protein EDB84DRAFT_1659369 [Lactarius hengduanensis]
MEAKLASMNLKSPGLKSTMPDAANTVGNDAAATLAQQRAKLKAASNAAHRISALALASSGERGTWAGVLGQVAERDNSPTQEISIEPRSSRPQSTNFSGLSAGSAFRSPRADGGAAPGGLDGLSPAKTSSNNNNGQTVDLAAAKLLYLSRSLTPHYSINLNGNDHLFSGLLLLIHHHSTQPFPDTVKTLRQRQGDYDEATTTTSISMATRRPRQRDHDD